jgi:hypothetical protein
MNAVIVRLIYHVLFCGITGLTCASLARAQDYQVTLQDYQYLQQYSVINAFDSAVVNYVFGEVRVGNQTLQRQVLPDTILKLDSVLYNGNSTGNQTTLAAALRTHPFLIDSLDSMISFHRELRARMVNSETGEYTSAWRFNDRSEFVVQLCRQSDNAVLATLDSVGIDSSSALSTNAAIPYGTQVGQWSRKSTIPSGLTNMQVYVRVMPRVIGTGPYGMTAFRNQSRMSRRLLYGHSADAQAGDSIPFHDSVRFHFIIQSYVNEYAEYCYFTERNYLELSTEQGDSLLSAFFVLDTTFYDANGVLRFTPIPCDQAKERQRLQALSAGFTATTNVDGIVFRARGPLTTVVLAWFDMAGRQVTEQRSVLIASEGTIVPYPRGLSPQPYILRWYETSSGAVGTHVVPIVSGQK